MQTRAEQSLQKSASLSSDLGIILSLFIKKNTNLYAMHTNLDVSVGGVTDCLIKAYGMEQKEQKAMIEEFKDGELNVLVATSIAEEGLDIPEVNEVIFYEPIPSAIRSIQRRGRTARLSKGALKILVTKKTLDEVFHYVSINKEKRMHRAIDAIKKDFNAEDKQQTLL